LRLGHKTPNRDEATALGAAAIPLDAHGCHAIAAKRCAPGLCVTLKIPAVLKNPRVSASLVRLRFHGAAACRNHWSFRQWLSQQQRRSGSKPDIRLAPVIFLQEPFLADVTGCPNATQPEPFTVSVFFLRPPKVNWQVICGIWLDWRKGDAAGR